MQRENVLKKENGKLFILHNGKVNEKKISFANDGNEIVFPSIFGWKGL